LTKGLEFITQELIINIKFLESKFEKNVKMMKSILLTVALTMSLFVFSQVKDIDGNKYKTVKIGEQVWMAENLKVSHFRNGDLIPHLNSDSLWNEAVRNKKPGWCYLENDSINNNGRGKLYNYYALIDPRGIAIEGWRVANEADWNTLSMKLGGYKVCGFKLKDTKLWETANGINGNNESGFSALPSGGRTWRGFEYFGNNSWAIYWVAQPEQKYLTMHLHSHNRGLSLANMDDTVGFAIRLIKQ
jgi:uncharacterized protein (TIGR02145 family)